MDDLISIMWGLTWLVCLAAIAWLSMVWFTFIVFLLLLHRGACYLGSVLTGNICRY